MFGAARFDAHGKPRICGYVAVNIHLIFSTLANSFAWTFVPKINEEEIVKTDVSPPQI